jgi:hypothetical protein
MKTSMAGPLGVLLGAPAAATIVVDEDINAGPPGRVGAEGPESPTINVKTSTMGPREVPELKVRDHPPST